MYETQGEKTSSDLARWHSVLLPPDGKRAVQEVKGTVVSVCTRVRPSCEHAGLKSEFCFLQVEKGMWKEVEQQQASKFTELITHVLC